MPQRSPIWVQQLLFTFCRTGPTSGVCNNCESLWHMNQGLHCDGWSFENTFPKKAERPHSILDRTGTLRLVGLVETSEILVTMMAAQLQNQSHGVRNQSQNIVRLKAKQRSRMHCEWKPSWTLLKYVCSSELEFLLHEEITLGKKWAPKNTLWALLSPRHCIRNHWIRPLDWLLDWT